MSAASFRWPASGEILIINYVVLPSPDESREGEQKIDKSSARDSSRDLDVDRSRGRSRHG